MKAKKDRLKSLFVHINKRLPPDDHTVKILYKTKEGEYGISNGLIVNTQQRQLQTGMCVTEDMKGTGYFATEWTILY